MGLLRHMGVSLYAPERQAPLLTPPVPPEPPGAAQPEGNLVCDLPPGCERLPLPFFFFSFFSFGLANPNRRVDVDVDTGVWL